MGGAPTVAGLLAAAGGGLAAAGTGGLPGILGFAPTDGLAGITGFGLGAGGGPLLPITLFGLEEPGVDDGELPDERFIREMPLATGVTGAAGAGAGGGRRATGGGGGGGADSINFRLVGQ